MIYLKAEQPRDPILSQLFAQAVIDCLPTDEIEMKESEWTFFIKYPESNPSTLKAISMMEQKYVVKICCFISFEANGF